MKKRIAGSASIIIATAFMLLCGIRQSLAYDLSFFERIRRDFQASISAASKPHKPIHKCSFVYTYKEAVSGQTDEEADESALDSGAELTAEFASSVVTPALGHQANAVAAAQDKARGEFKNEVQAARRLPGKAKRDAMVAAQLRYQRAMRALSGLQDLIKEKAFTSAEQKSQPAGAQSK